MAANGHAGYDQYSQVFYQRARQYIEADEMKLPMHQALCLVAAFEAKRMLFTRASMSCAKAVRLCQMMGLDRLDGARDDLPPALGPHSTWEELEERRRVFWGAFAIDSHASISTG
ncbi:binuclear zinc transcription factor [Metarhizium album ARSEF 1941]|uniref:Binuclear zinc transcription factor n=1 Tax=Metarhizium album (strain ARSEF 1941) TaxID=1081103 RepID=A0A0B2X5T3_METAS|nr:binuclear zinc transcription factor [Metarhizium album ARSEF 1941]KHO00785.1 binuclear zinc transcription factor [Metarhizium album ARSEF 1941]